MGKEPVTESTMELAAPDAYEKRTSWGNWFEFLLSCMGFSIGLGNVWRFPYICFNNGAGAFLIPYTIMLVFAGIPLYFLELSLGQYATRGPITVWNCCPLFKGIGYGMVVVSAWVCVYYNVVIAWVFYYLFMSFQKILPWETCTNWWNTVYCSDIDVDCRADGGVMDNFTCRYNLTEYQLGNITANSWISPSEEYFQNNVLQLTSDISEPGEVMWVQALCLLLSWIVLFLCLIKGIKSSGKVVYVTVTFPFVLLFILLIRGVTLDGYYQGIVYYVTPDWDKLFTIRVWAAAATQIFYSLGIAFGGIMTMSSYNKFSNNVLRDALLVSLLNCCTSVFAGFVIFAILGSMAHNLGVDVADVVKSGAGLAFIAYPSACAEMPVSPLWSVLFFLMLLTLGLDSQFAMFETCMTAILDEFPSLYKKKVLLLLVLSVIMFLLGLPMVTQGGMYVFQIFDWYSASYSLMILAFCECIVLCYFYGLRRFTIDITAMIGFSTNGWIFYFKGCWLFISPILLLGILVFSCYDSVPAYYFKDEPFPFKYQFAGYMMTLSSVIFIPILAIVQIAKEEGPILKRIQKLLKPVDWGPVEAEDRDKVNQLRELNGEIQLNPIRRRIVEKPHLNPAFSESIPEISNNKV